MQAHVKTPHTKIYIEGKISNKLLQVLKEDYGKKVVIENDEWILAKEAEWYKKTKKNMTSNDYMRVYRETRGYSQKQLGEMLGGLSRQRISDIEKGRRPLNKEIAKRLAKIFNTPVNNFL